MSLDPVQTLSDLMSGPGGFVIAALACYRITMFIVLDDGPFMIMHNIRKALGAFDWEEGKEGDKHKRWTGDFVSCPYCVGEWVALAVLAALIRPIFIIDVFLLWQGLAGLAALAQSIGRRQVS